MNQFNFKSIIQASNAIIVDPSKSLMDFGIDYMLMVTCPTLFLGWKVIDLVHEKQREREEKERMYKQIIAKQQAVIKKLQDVNRELEIRIRRVECQDENNRREIAKLREQVNNLENLIDFLEQCAKQIVS